MIEAKNAFRRDIEGLRALAVLAVILFHVDLAFIPGGFVGVDVFFVISGFLITRQILAQTRSKTFSFKRFYIRRIRRLLPAVAVTALLCLAAAAVLMTPADFEHTARSAAASILSLANVFFWLDAGYFSEASWTKPLLHTWSLSVEEQFYLIWPALIFVCGSRVRRQGALFWGLIVVITVIATGASIYLTRSHPSAAFYMMPLRLHEFAIGALCVPVIDRMQTWKREGAARLLATLLFYAGLFMTAAAFLLITSETPFPGAASLWPSLATAAIIVGGSTAWNTSVLSNRVMGWLGRISYSVYLAHWPLIVFTKYIGGETLSSAAQIVLIVLSILVGAILYYGVEQTFRERKVGDYPKRRSFWLAAMPVCVIIAASVVIHQSGMAWRLGDGDKRSIADNTANLRGSVGCRTNICDFGDLDSRLSPVFLIGDSHSHHYFDAFNEAFKLAGRKGTLIQDGNCAIYTSDVHVNQKENDQCPEISEAAREAIRSHPGAPVVISQNWGRYWGLRPAPGEPTFMVATKPQEKQKELGEYHGQGVSKYFAQFGPRPVFILGPTPGTRIFMSLEACRLRPNFANPEEDDVESCIREPRRQVEWDGVEAGLEAAAKAMPSTLYLETAGAFCDVKYCYTGTQDEIFYSDNTHLTLAGSRRVLAHTQLMQHLSATDEQ